MEAKELFISYGRDPIVTKFVHKLKTDLEAVGFSVWLDSEDIPAGSDWHGAIGAGLSNCKAILPIMTNKYLGSRYCVNEVWLRSIAICGNPTDHFFSCSFTRRIRTRNLSFP